MAKNNKGKIYQDFPFFCFTFDAASVSSFQFQKG